jgi:hypothetical protein
VPWDRLSLWKWVPRIFPGVNAAGAYGWRPTTLVMPNVTKIRCLKLPGNPLGQLGLLRDDLYLYIHPDLSIFRVTKSKKIKRSGNMKREDKIETDTKFWWRKLKKWGHSGFLGLCGRIIVIWNLKNRNGLIWLRWGQVFGSYWLRNQPLGSTMLIVACLAKGIPLSQDILSCT